MLFEEDSEVEVGRMGEAEVIRYILFATLLALHCSVDAEQSFGTRAAWRLASLFVLVSSFSFFPSYIETFFKAEASMGDAEAKNMTDTSAIGTPQCSYFVWFQTSTIFEFEL